MREFLMEYLPLETGAYDFLVDRSRRVASVFDLLLKRGWKVIGIRGGDLGESTYWFHDPSCGVVIVVENPHQIGEPADMVAAY